MKKRDSDRPSRPIDRIPNSSWLQRRRWPQVPRLIMGYCTVALLLGLTPPPEPGGRTAAEVRLKASFVYRFTHFVEWPEEAFAHSGSPLVTCVVGWKQLAGSLEAVTRDRTAKNRSVRVVRVSIDPSGETDFELPNCHVLFVAQSEAAAFKGIAARLWNQPVLTIGEDARFAEVGGMIRLVEQDRRLGFEINRPALEAAGLRYSSQLLRLATVIHDGGRD